MGRTVRATAPIRVCDLGGWTDTWFAGHGAVLHLAVTPRVHVRVEVQPRTTADDPPPVTLHAVDYGDRYAVVPGDTDRVPHHPLLEAAIDEIGVDDDVTIDVEVHSEAPAGCSTGTSAAIAVALVGALDAGRSNRRTRSRMEVARAAHRLETERLGLQSGIQDQLASAFGGIDFVEMRAYPEASVTPVAASEATQRALDDRLVVVFLGRRHDSSAVHEKVIAELTGEGPDSSRLEALRECAHRGRAALEAGDLDGFGAVMVDNTDAQAALHPDLVSREASAAIAVARASGCVGWKVNGAGGEGGSIALLLGTSSSRTDVEAALRDVDPSFAMIPSRLSPTGLEVSESPSTRPST